MISIDIFVLQFCCLCQCCSCRRHSYICFFQMDATMKVAREERAALIGMIEKVLTPSNGTQAIPVSAAELAKYPTEVKSIDEWYISHASHVSCHSDVFVCFYSLCVNTVLLYEHVLCALRLDAVFQGKAAKIRIAKDAFDAMGIDEDTLHMMTEADFTKQNVAIAIARQLSVAIAAIKQK